MPISLPTLADIHAAEERIRPTIPPTPFLQSRTLSEMFGCELWLKFENLNFTASFKERGALNKLLLLTPRNAKKAWSRSRPVITRWRSPTTRAALA